MRTSYWVAPGLVEDGPIDLDWVLEQVFELFYSMKDRANLVDIDEWMSRRREVPLNGCDLDTRDEDGKYDWYMSCDTCGVTIDNFFAQDRHRPLPMLRAIFVNLVSRGDIHVSHLAEYLQRDRTTLLHYFRNHRDNMEAWPQYRDFYNRCKYHISLARV